MRSGGKQAIFAFLALILLSALPGAPASAATLADDLTINGAPTRGMSIPSGTILHAFTLTESSSVTLTMLTEGRNLVVGIETQSGVYIIHDSTISSGSPGNPSTRSCDTLLNPGTYHAYVQQLYGDSIPSNYQLTLTGTRITDVDTEPNDSFGNAIPIAPSQPALGFFSGDDDKDFYKLTLDRDGGMQIRLELLAGDAREHGYITLYDAQQKWVGETRNNHITNWPVTLNAGTHYICLTNVYACTYRLTVIPYKTARNLTISPASLSMIVGDTRQLSVTVDPADCEETVYWKTSDYSTASADNGLVTAKSPGDCTITAYVESGVEASVSVHVEFPTTTTLGFPTKLRLTKGFQYAPIAPSIPDGTKLPELVWSSSKPGVLTVAQDGSLSAIKKGTATLTVAAKGGSPSASCKVTVGANELKRSKPLSDGPGLFSCAKRLYYSGKYLYIEVYLYNRTGRRVTKSGKLRLHLYDFAYSEDRPFYEKTISWSFGTLYNKKYAVYRTRLPRSQFGGFDLGAGQIEAVLVGNFKAKSVPRKTAVSP